MCIYIVILYVCKCISNVSGYWPRENYFGNNEIRRPVGIWKKSAVNACRKMLTNRKGPILLAFFSLYFQNLQFEIDSFTTLDMSIWSIWYIYFISCILILLILSDKLNARKWQYTFCGKRTEQEYLTRSCVYNYILTQLMCSKDILCN